MVWFALRTLDFGPWTLDFGLWTPLGKIPPVDGRNTIGERHSLASRGGRTRQIADTRAVRFAAAKVAGIRRRKTAGISCGLETPPLEISQKAQGHPDTKAEEEAY